MDPDMDRRASRRMKSPLIERRPPAIRRESPMMSNRGPISRNDPYDYPPSRPKLERETHGAYKILCVGNLNNKINDNAIRDNLHREFSRFGDVLVKVCHDDNERFAYIYFRSYEEAREAKHAKSRLILFDKVLEIEPIYDRTLPSSQSSRRRSLTPDYGGPPQLGPPTNQRTSNLRSSGPILMSHSPPPHQPNRRPPPMGSGHQSTTALMLKPHHHNPNYQRNYNPMNNHHQPDHHSNNYSNAGPQRMNHNMHPNNNNHMRNDYHNNNNHHSNPNHHNPNHHGNQSIHHPNHHMRPQQRESKKDKFPNYLHHIPPEEDEKATRTLFVGNLEPTISDQDLKRIFEKYGSVEDIDVKRPQPGQGNAYAFIKFLNLDMAHRCKVEMSGQYIGKFQCKIGYGKCTPTTRIWVGGLGSWTSLSHLEREFDRFGAIRKIDFVKGDNHAYIQYDSIDAAQAACQDMRGFPLGGPERRLRVDFADPEPYNYTADGRPADPNAPFPATGVTEEDGSTPLDSNNSTLPKNGDSSSATSFNQRFNNNNGNNSTNNNNQSESGAPYLNTNEEWPEDSDELSTGNQIGTATSPRAKRPRISDGSDVTSVAKKVRPALEDVESTVMISENVSTVPELIKCCAIVWNGGLILKSMVFPSRMFLCSGDVALIDQLMKDPVNEIPVLRITQRLRLDPVRLEDVSRRMSTAGVFGHCMLLTTAGSNSMQFNTGGEDGSQVQARPLRYLVSYLKQKEAAGVVSLNTTKDGKEVQGVLYVFPPCDYATDLLKKQAPNLVTDSSKDTKEEYLVIIVVKG